MNSDQILNLLKQIITLIGGLLAGAGLVHISMEQITAVSNNLIVIIPASASLASIFWSVYTHWDMKKVPETAVALQLPSGVPVPPVGAQLNLTPLNGKAKVVG